MNQDIFELLISKDEDKSPYWVLDVAPDVYTCLICASWIGTEENALEHESLHPHSYCHFCNRLIYILDLPDNPFKGPIENTVPICSVCYKNALANSKTFAYKWYRFYNALKRRIKHLK